MNVIRKSTEIAKILRSQILSGKIISGKLSSERILSEQFQVARNTIRSALSVLEQDGLIKRQRRTGTAVSSPQEYLPKKTVALVMRTTGHLYEDRYKCFLEAFLKKGYAVYTVSTHFRGNWSNPVTEQRQRQTFDSLIKHHPPDLIVYDLGYEMLESFQEKVSDFDAIPIDFSGTEYTLDKKGVWNDYRNAGYLAGKYLLDSGCKRPVIFTNCTWWSKRFISHVYEKHREKLCIEGFRQALDEAGIDPEPLVLSPYSRNLREHFKFLSEFAAEESLIPDGFFGTADNLVAEYMKYLNEFHGDSCRTVRFIGLGNTPWSRELPLHPFSSIYFDYQEIFDNVIRMAETEPSQRRDIFIQPKLIVR